MIRLLNDLPNGIKEDFIKEFNPIIVKTLQEKYCNKPTCFFSNSAASFKLTEQNNKKLFFSVLALWQEEFTLTHKNATFYLNTVTWKDETEEYFIDEKQFTHEFSDWLSKRGYGFSYTKQGINIQLAYSFGGVV